MSDIVLEVFSTFMYSPSFPKVSLNSDFYDYSNFLVPGAVMKEIVVNLFNNAFEEIENTSIDTSNYKINTSNSQTVSDFKAIEINYITDVKGKKIGISIKNICSEIIQNTIFSYYGSGYTTRKNRSGTGLSVAKCLSETIGFQLKTEYENGSFTALLKLIK